MSGYVLAPRDGGGSALGEVMADRRGTKEGKRTWRRETLSSLTRSWISSRRGISETLASDRDTEILGPTWC
jgi:hypothetical protein